MNARLAVALPSLVLLLPSFALAEDNGLLTAVAPTSLSGHVDTSFIWQISGGKTDVGRSFDGSDRQNAISFNMAELVLDKALSDQEGDWSAGYRIAVIAGPDAASTGANIGLHNALVKARIPVGNGLVLKMGLFTAIDGYECLESYKNANFSHSFGFYFEPGRQTGLLLDYKVSSALSLTAGVGNAYSPGRPNVRPTVDAGGVLIPAEWGLKNLMAAVSLTAPGDWGPLSGAWLYATIVHGKTGVPGTLSIDATDYFVGVGASPVKGLDLTLTYDNVYSKHTGDPREPGFPPPRAYAVAFYTSVKATEKLTLSNRIDWAHAEMGTFGADVSGKSPATPDVLLSETFTVGYAFWTHVVSRVELRYDRDLSDLNGGRAAFGDGSSGSRNALSFLFNLDYVF